MMPLANAQTDNAYQNWIQVTIIIFMFFLLIACTPQSSTPQAIQNTESPTPKAIISSTPQTIPVVASSTPHLTSTPKATMSAAEDAEAKFQAFERGYLRKLPDRMKYYEVPGVSIAIINQGAIQKTLGYGVVDAGSEQPVTEDTLFQAASISKPLVAMAALYYVQNGMLSLDEDVNNQLISWKVPDNEYTLNSKVTLRSLLSHSAGLSVHGFMGYSKDEKTPTLLQILNGEPPANSDPIRVFVEPGTISEYSGGGYEVVQQLLEDVSGKPFPEMMQEIVLQKLGMENSKYQQPLLLSLSDLAATGHNIDGGIIAVNGKWNTYPEMAAAGLWTTPSDLARFVIEIQQSARGKSNQILSTEMTQEMITQQLGEWGLGLRVGGSGDQAWFNHGGANNGFRCLMFGLVKNGQGVVIMTNSDNGIQLSLEITSAVAKAYRWPYQP